MCPKKWKRKRRFFRKFTSIPQPHSLSNSIFSHRIISLNQNPLRWFEKTSRPFPLANRKQGWPDFLLLPSKLLIFHDYRNNSNKWVKRRLKSFQAVDIPVSSFMLQRRWQTLKAFKRPLVIKRKVLRSGGKLSLRNEFLKRLRYTQFNKRQVFIGTYLFWEWC